MKEIVLKKAFIKNFLSIGEEPIEIIFAPGIHIITGANLDKTDSKNGVGKSAIADAIFFGIFGSTLRPLKKEDITNWVNKKECSVTVSFDVIDNGKVNEFVSLRSLNPSRVQLIKNGEDISRTIGKTKDEIYDILGTTPDMIIQSVIMSLNEAEPFLSKTPAVKRKFIEDIYKMEVFGRMTDYIRKDFNETKRLYDTEIEKIADFDVNIQLHKKQQQEQIEKRKSRINDLEGRKVSTIEELDVIDKKIKEVEIKKSNLNIDHKEKILNEIEELKQKDRQLEELSKQYIKTITINQSIVISLKNKIAELEKLTDGVCIYCKQPFSESNKQEKLNLIEQYKKQIEDCDQIIKNETNNENTIRPSRDRIEDLKDQCLQRLRNIENIENELNQLQREYQQQQKWLTQVDSDIEKIKNEKDSYINIISDLTTRRDVLTQTVEEYKNKLTRLETDKFIVSDEGVKNHIVKKMLNMLNGRLNYYLKQLDAPCICVFNEYFDETITNDRGRTCSYFNFSGGERKRIDLAMLFTFMDVRRKQSGISINLGLYDELLDTALDAIGIEGTLNILKDRVLKNKEAIYIISHKNEAVKHATGEIIYLEKENGITRRKPYDRSYTDNAISAS
ncbi:MAG: AAA family ATPase [Clostridia bacterium]|nr:AAA family ATPase [Clostridia bacterium]